MTGTADSPMIILFQPILTIGSSLLPTLQACGVGVGPTRVYFSPCTIFVMFAMAMKYPNIEDAISTACDVFRGDKL